MQRDDHIYLKPSRFIDSDDPAVIEFAIQSSKHSTSIDIAIDLYNRIRDQFYYDPFTIDLRPEGLKASKLLTKRTGYCIEKATLLAATARALNIPSKVGFARVINHIGTEKLEKVLKTNLIVFHGYTVLYLENRWVKCTPAFNSELCEKLNVAPLDFDGKVDSLFQALDQTGETFMEYAYDYGVFADIPYDLMIREMKTYYPHLFTGKSTELLLHLDRKPI